MLNITSNKCLFEEKIVFKLRLWLDPLDMSSVFPLLPGAMGKLFSSGEPEYLTYKILTLFNCSALFFKTL